MEKAEVGVHVSLRNILYAIDFSRSSNLALPYILSVARKYGSKVFVVHVIALAPFPIPPTQALQAIGAQAQREAKEALAALEPAWKDIPSAALIRKGDIWTELSGIIEEN
jgi:nucleotide-binding universal stress UspA family protein